MTEHFRPQYHLTPLTEWMNDVQRPIYIDGVHHLYYLYNKDYSLEGNGTEWAHAVSTDLVHWERKPVAIEKYKDSAGDPWAGSCVIDVNNTAGFGYNAIIAIVTMPNPTYQCNHLWYSTDGGNTFTHYGTEPIMHNPTGYTDFRDPKIIWHEPTKKWIMLMAERDKVGFYTSYNLKEWTYVSTFVRDDIGIIECPDLFELNIDGNPANKKWVLLLGGNGFNYGRTTCACYFLGNFDGTKFYAETDIEWLENGADSYAGVTWDAPYTNGNYRYFVSWMGNWNYASEVPWETFIGNASIVRELHLRSTSEGIKLVQIPVSKLNETLREFATFGEQVIYTGQENLLQNIHETSFAIETTIIIDDSTRSKFGFSLRDGNGNGEHTVLMYDKSNNELIIDRSKSGIVHMNEYLANMNEFARLYKATVKPRDGRIKLEIFVDRSTVEVFVNEGESVFSLSIFPDISSDGLRLWTDDCVHIEYLKVRVVNEVEAMIY
ncbi:glycoside hydrolase family 32 protein [Bacillus gobiensis]|uniref:glycoside hydrolase family 32 protein n=1 Tax=Bacillus gobiensis TaxID=1441095 RepID=UPI003D1AA73C